MKDYKNVKGYNNPDYERAIKSKQSFLDCNPNLPEALKEGVREEIKQIRELLNKKK